MIEFRTGDLFSQGFQAIGHGVNCRGAMGAGIALQFARRWPAMEREYRRRCWDGMLVLGSIHVWTDGTITIYNMATQRFPGPNANLRAIRTSLALSLTDAEQKGISEIGIPRIGSGIGGLDWLNVENAIRDVAQESNVKVVVMSLEEVW